MPRSKNRSSFPQKKTVPPAPAKSSKPSIGSTMGSTMAQGFSFGAGSAIAHNVIGTGIDKLFNKSSNEPVDQCEIYRTMLNDCRDNGYMCDYLSNLVDNQCSH